MSEEDLVINLKISDTATNIEVGETLEIVFNKFLSIGAKAIVCKMLPNEHKIYIKPFLSLKIKKLDSFSMVNMVLKDELRPNYLEHYSFVFAESIIDIWNKFMPMEFVLMIDSEDKYNFSIGWDEGMNKKQIEAYWLKNSSDGYNTEALFWTREWLKDEHKLKSTGGGKI